MDRHMDHSCMQRVHCLHRSFVIVHTECGKWQASFTQEKSACFVEVSVTEHILPPRTRAWERGLAQHIHNLLKKIHGYRM